MKTRPAFPSINFHEAAVCLLLAVTLTALPGCSSRRLTESAPRERILMVAGWRFQLAPDVTLTNTVEVVNWRWKTASEGGHDTANAAAAADTSGPDWHEARTGDDTFRGQVGFQWFRTTLPEVAGPGRTIHFDTVDDNGTVYLNGRRLLQHEGWNEPFDVPLDEAWKPGGPNMLAVLVENTAGAGGITAKVTLGRRPSAGPQADCFAPGFDDHGWRQVHLPHDYVVEGAFTSEANAGHGSLPTPTAWYRKSFTLPDGSAGKSVWIDFEGVYRDSLVYLNGKQLGEHKSGYTSFRYDITPDVNFKRRKRAGGACRSPAFRRLVV